MRFFSIIFDNTFSLITMADYKDTNGVTVQLLSAWASSYLSY